MKKIVLIFGLISGAILSAMMLLALLFKDAIGFDRGEIIGYTTMVLASLLIFFGVRSYRDTVAGGTVRFGRAFAVGILIGAVASACYVATWEVVFFNFDFASGYVAKYQAHELDKARASGESEAAIAKKQSELAKQAELYKNPAINAAVTFLEPLPVVLIMALLSAGVLSRRRKGTVGEGGTVAGTAVSM